MNFKKYYIEIKNCHCMEVGEEGLDWLVEAQSFHCWNILGDEYILYLASVDSYMVYSVTTSQESGSSVCLHSKPPWLALCDPVHCSPQAPLSMGLSRQEDWGGLPCPPSGAFLTQGSNLCLLCHMHWQVGSLHKRTWEALCV